MTTNKKNSSNTLYVLKTSQAVVHISHSITLRQYKYWVLLLHFYRESYKNNMSSSHDVFYRVPIAKLAEYLGYEPVKAELKDDFEVLRKEPIIINILSKDGHKVQRGMGFISEWEVSSKTLGFRLPSFLQDVMKGLDDAKAIFHLLHWEIFSSFNGKYEAILYKLCKDYIGVQRTPYMTIADFRQYIGLQENEYLQFAELNRWTISKPLKVINESIVSDILVDVEFKRNGRKAEGLYFKVQYKQQRVSIASITDMTQDSHPAFAQAKITIPKDEQDAYLQKYGIELVLATIERANLFVDEKQKQGETVNIGAIYSSAFSKNWGVQYLQQKQLQIKSTKQEVSDSKQKSASKDTRELPDKEDKSQLLKKWDNLTLVDKEAYFKRALNNVPKVMKSIELDKANVKNAMSRPLIRIELEKLLLMTA